MATRIPQRRLRDLAVLLCIGLLPAPAAPADTAPTPWVAVELPDLNKKERAWAEDPTSIPGPLRLGFGRQVPVAPVLDALLPSRWQQIPDGSRLLSVRVRSPDALGLRIAVEVAAPVLRDQKKADRSRTKRTLDVMVFREYGALVAKVRRFGLKNAVLT